MQLHLGQLLVAERERGDGAAERLRAVGAEGEVAEAVEDHAVFVTLNTLQYVRVVADDRGGAGVDRRAPETTLIVAQLGLALLPPVERHQYDIGLLLGGGNVSAYM